jgi:NADH-quinone oxidoreductase subunit N
MIDAVSWATATPELLLLAMACVIALFDLFVDTRCATPPIA